MTHFRDLSPVNYHDGPMSCWSWDCPLLAVGWLEKGFEYNAGGVPVWFASRIAELRKKTGEMYPQYTFRGLHSCSLCGDDSQLPHSHINVFIPGNHCVYVASGGIVHYAKHHGYAPPIDFVTALDKCPDPRTPKYVSALRKANNGNPPPLEVDRPFKPSCDL